MSGGDAIVNIVLRESYPDIVDLLNVDQVASLLFASGRITLPELDQLQGASGILLTDQKRKHILYSAALADKGQEGLDAFLRALCETAGQYAPHARLLDKLCSKPAQSAWYIAKYCDVKAAKIYSRYRVECHKHVCYGGFSRGSYILECHAMFLL